MSTSRWAATAAAGWRRDVNVMIVWALTGLWHGAGWHFVLWGLYFGVLLILESAS